jgi:ribosomal protein S6--L-glutamate ligase
VAEAAADAIGLGQCGVDLILEEEGPTVIEVNPTPGFLHLEEATGIDIARLLVADALYREDPRRQG